MASAIGQDQPGMLVYRSSAQPRRQATHAPDASSRTPGSLARRADRSRCRRHHRGHGAGLPARVDTVGSAEEARAIAKAMPKPNPEDVEPVAKVEDRRTIPGPS
jgi:hypothetical protein